jgi:hypothetical protein
MLLCGFSKLQAYEGQDIGVWASPNIWLSIIFVRIFIRKEAASIELAEHSSQLRATK